MEDMGVFAGAWIAASTIFATPGSICRAVFDQTERMAAGFLRRPVA
jgi:hypothetical protein